MEQSFVGWAKVRCGSLPQVKLGIGDDAAVLAGDGSDTIVTTDCLLDGVHFRLGEVQPRQIGRKSVLVNLSDLAAMAAEPTAVFLTLCLPPEGPEGMPSDALAAEIFEGVCSVCQEYDIALAGGDTNCWQGQLVVNVAAVGRSVDGKIWTRSGARPDDLIVVTGPLGGSLSGKHLEFTPRLDVAPRLRDSPAVHAAMDISDGLSIDLLRLSDASRCGAIVDLDKIPVSDAAKNCAIDSKLSPVQHALSDGEDFELILAVEPSQLDDLVQRLQGVCQPSVCGKFTSRTGLWSRRGSRLEQLPVSGYLHG